ncbi:MULTISPECIES: Uma2 family endonuclease [Kitasatospora]|uniref:Uma2 family endonuclease n=1 Tax=Kitasatospora cathayae TaxID=3004092 RepID=A0ABY7Q1E5_9ACTN|nr:Uma2 family endonuclease [Kitasatospora sp. HUAS 3-15]WBP86520.1 Uma2 family endonuclease [Kitasatospora sp. HUAS 3-15]
MTAVAHEQPITGSPSQADILLESFLSLHSPEGFRAELIEGEIIVAPPPDGDHEDYIDLLIDQVKAKSEVHMQVSGGKGLRLVSGGLCPKNHVIPDATFAPRSLRLFRGAPPWMEPDGVALVAEITSTKPDQDRIAKRHCYARAGIPLYVLVDREKSQISLFSKPHREEYTEVHLAAFGEPLAFPAPFDFELDTKDFL